MNCPLPVLVGVLLFSQTADDSYRSWTLKQAAQVLTDSPWSRQMVLTQPVIDEYRSPAIPGQDPRRTVTGARDYGLSKDAGIGGDKELIYTYTVRFFSALPVRQAHIRLAQLRSKYDHMSAEEMKAFDEKLYGILAADVGSRILISVQLSTNDEEAGIEVDQQLRAATFESLRQKAYLLTENRGRIPLEDYIPPGPDGTGAKLVFPRELNSEPVISRKSRQVRLEFFVPGTGHKLYVGWNIRDMVQLGTVVY